LFAFLHSHATLAAPAHGGAASTLPEQHPIRYNEVLCLPPARSPWTPPLPPRQAWLRAQRSPKPRPLRA